MTLLNSLFKILVIPALVLWTQFVSLASMITRRFKLVITLFKRLIKVLIAATLIGLVAIAAIVTLIDPNKFKGFIEKQVTSTTGRILTIEGPIHWQLNPGLSLAIYDLTLADAPMSSSAFLTLKKANVTPKFWSLFSGKLLMNLQLEGLNVNLHFADTIQSLSGNVAFDSKWHFNFTLQQLELQNLEFIAAMQDFPTTTLTGKLHFQLFKDPSLIEGTFQATNLDLQTWSSLFNFPHASMTPKTIDLKSTFKYHPSFLEVASFTLSPDNGGTLEGSFKTRMHNNPLQILNLTGAFHGKDLRIGLFPITEIKTVLEAKGGIYRFDQIHAQFMNSQHQGTLQIDTRSHTPQFSLVDQMDSFNINELLTFFGEKDKVNGKTEIKATLTTEGATLEECLHNLSGQAHISLMNGNLRGIALPPLLQHAQSTVSLLADTLLKKEAINISALLTAELGEWKQQAINFQPLSTPFQLVKTNVTIDHGKISTSDFELSHSEYTINGQGTIDLIQKNMEYQALALLNHVTLSTIPAQSIANFLKTTPLSIRVKGPLNNLSVNPDLAHYAEGAIKLVQKGYSESPKENPLEKLFEFP